MKVTRKISHEMPKAVKRPENEELAPSLRLRELPKEIEGLEPGKDFEAHIKGKCISHDHQKGRSSEYGGMMDGNGEENKDHHHYELEVHVGRSAARLTYRLRWCGSFEACDGAWSRAHLRSGTKAGRCASVARGRMILPMDVDAVAHPSREGG